MLQHNTNNISYFVSKNKEKSKNSRDSISNKQKNQILKILASEVIRENPPNLEELERIIQNSLFPPNNEDAERKTPDEQFPKDGYPFVKLLKDEGYVRENKRWLTNRGFLDIGSKILHDLMKDLESSEFGLHETNSSGYGSIITETTKPFELGNDIRHLSVHETILNSVQRHFKFNKDCSFPLSLEYGDFVEYETMEDVKAAVVYCIDLSSTMRYSFSKNGLSRIQAAKRALWSLYVLNKKFFPSDSVYVIGFASLASLINPYDIPFLKTYDAGDNFLHYTNYQSALRLARKILKKDSAQNKRIVLITDGQPSACFVDTESQKDEILSEKPYSNFYTPEVSLVSKIKTEHNMSLEINNGSLVYLCYRYKKVDPKISTRTMLEAKKCKRDGIDIDTIVVGDETELFEYAQGFEKELRGKTYHINKENIDQILVNDYLTKKRKILSSRLNW